MHLVDDNLQLNAHYLPIGKQIVNCCEIPHFQGASAANVHFLWHAWVQGGPCWCQDTPCQWQCASCYDNMYIVSYDLCSDGVDGYNGWVHWDQIRVTCDSEDNLQGANYHWQGAPCKYTLPECTLSVIICTLLGACTLLVTYIMLKVVMFLIVAMSYEKWWQFVKKSQGWFYKKEVSITEENVRCMVNK